MRSYFVSIFALTLLVSYSGETVVEVRAEPQSSEIKIGKYASSDPLPIEDVGTTANIASYPDSVIFAHNMNFYSIIDGNINLIDVAADTQEFMGSLAAGQMALFAESTRRNELYVAETYYARGTRGEETDVLTIYDKTSLAPISEIILPGGKRAQTVTQKGSFQLIDNDRLAVVFNFTPASSVTIVDLDTRTIQQEIPITGCMLTFPLKGAAFATLCGNGSVASYSIAANGDVREVVSEPFNNIDDDPLFMKSGRINDVEYFPTFKGNVRPIDVSTDVAKPLEQWSLVTDAERAKNWRPSGWQIVSGQPDGNLYVLMQENGSEGSHKQGGSEVWAFDVKTKKKVNTIKLNNGGLTIEVTHGNPGYLVVTNAAMMLDVYTLDGDLERSITINDIATPFLLYAKR
ncbi:MAG: amine dehydrogenase [Rhizobiales bacterium]|nr:amine dehydrogenase [Hyphomicrobiales bacterium]